MDELQILVVADDPLARAGLMALLNGQAGFNVVGQVAARADWIDELQSTACAATLPPSEAVAVYRPDVVLWDLGWGAAQSPTTSGIQDDLASVADTGIPIVALLPDRSLASDAWIAGARGLLLRSVAAHSLVAALGAVAQGLIALDPALFGVVTPIREGDAEFPVEDLTPRELEVLQLLAEGLSNKAIACRLEISEHTVKFHVNAILGKLGAQSRTEAVVRATRLGLILL
jgi:two-component system nitrate/nitrite response regulator NarL